MNIYVILIIVTIYGMRIIIYHWSAAEIVEFRPAIWHLNPRIKWLGRSMTWRATSSVLSRFFFYIFRHSTGPHVKMQISSVIYGWQSCSEYLMFSCVFVTFERQAHQMCEDCHLFKAVGLWRATCQAGCRGLRAGDASNSQQVWRGQREGHQGRVIIIYIYAGNHV